MDKDQSGTPAFLKEIYPHAGGELLRLYQSAAENAYLLRSDFYTIRDWTELGDGRDDDALHAVLLLLFVALEEGSLCIELADASLRARLIDFVPEAEAADWARRILASIGSPAWARLVGMSAADHRPVIVHAANGRRFLYFQKHLRAELDFQRTLHERVAHADGALSPEWSAILEAVARTQPLQLDAEQERAVQAALSKNLVIISGGPGTGKTSIVLTLLRCLVRGGAAPERIALAAPTGRAAQRLTDSLRAGLDRLGSDSASPDASLRGLAAGTLHRLLGYRPGRNQFSRHCENPIPADVVIVDEVSMVGLVLMSQLFAAVAPETKLILLGDKDQLPAVDAGAVLAQLVPDGPSAVGDLLGDRVVLLKTNHRSEQAIRAAAEAINRQDAGIVERLPRLTLHGDATLDGQTGCFLLEQKARTANELRGFLQRWADRAYFDSRLDGQSLAQLVENADDSNLVRIFALMDRFRLLTLVRESAWGCDEINAFLDAYLRPRLDADGRGGLFAGAPVLVASNDAARGLFNGDVGIALREKTGALRVAFPRYDGAASFPAESLPAHELGFALTVHKSQGSEYANVMLIVPPKGAKRLLTKELIYTAVTRAKSLAVICAPADVLQQAIARRIVRESGVL